VNRVEQVENKISGTKDKIEELDQTVKDHKRILRKYEWTMQDTLDTMRKPNLCILGLEGEDIKSKGIENLFNRIIAENFPNFKEESHLCAGSLQDNKPSGPKQKCPQTCHNQNTHQTE
jgi:hypothetical protein